MMNKAQQLRIATALAGWQYLQRAPRWCVRPIKGSVSTAWHRKPVTAPSSARKLRERHRVRFGRPAAAAKAHLPAVLRDQSATTSGRLWTDERPSGQADNSALVNRRRTGSAIPPAIPSPNLMPASWVTHDPVTDVAKALADDGYSPSVRFGLLNEQSEIMFIGLIGQKW